MEMETKYSVTCPNGAYKEFDTRQEAHRYAEWGHACLTAKDHSIRSVMFEVFNTCPFDGETHKPSECATFTARMAQR